MMALSRGLRPCAEVTTSWPTGVWIMPARSNGVSLSGADRVGLSADTRTGGAPPLTTRLWIP